MEGNDGGESRQMGHVSPATFEGSAAVDADARAGVDATLELTWLNAATESLALGWSSCADSDPLRKKKRYPSTHGATMPTTTGIHATSKGEVPSTSTPPSYSSSNGILTTLRTASKGTPRSARLSRFGVIAHTKRAVGLTRVPVIVTNINHVAKETRQKKREEFFARSANT